MLHKRIIIVSILLSLVLIISSCTTSKKYRQLEASYQSLKKGYDKAQKQLDDRDARIEQLETELAGLKDTSGQEMAKLKNTYDELVKSLNKEVESGKIELNQIRGRLTVSIAEEIFFESGKAEIKPEGIDVLNRIATILKKVPEKNIRIEGHTDNVPIGSNIRETYPTNWELGAARAVNVVKYLEHMAGVDPLRLSAVSYGQYRPKATNRTSAGRAKNRRIEIVLIDRDLDLAKKMRENL
jgi:chemotaxis protein MotB